MAQALPTTDLTLPWDTLDDIETTLTRVAELIGEARDGNDFDGEDETITLPAWAAEFLTNTKSIIDDATNYAYMEE